MDYAILRLGMLIFLGLVSSSRLFAEAWGKSEIERIESSEHESLNELRALPEDCVVQTPVHAGFHSGFAPSSDSARWVQIDLGSDYPIDGVVVVPATLGNKTSYGFPLRFRIDAASDPLMSEPETLIEAFEPSQAEEHLSVYPRYVDGKKKEARYIRFTALSLAPEPRQKLKFIFCLGEILVFSGGYNVALCAKVLAPASAETNPTWAASHLVDGCHAMGIPSVATPRALNGWHSAIFKTPTQNSWVQIDLGESKQLGGIRLIPAHPADYPDRSGFGFPVCFKVETAVTPDFLEPSLVFDSGDRHFVNPGDIPVSFRFPQREARVVRVTATELWERNRDYVFALGELEALSGGTNVALSSSVISSDQTITALWKPEFLVDGNGGRGVLVDEHQWLKGLHQKRVLRGRLELLSAQRQEAERIAHDQLVFGGAVLCAIACLSALGFGLSLRSSRRKEIARLRNQISKDLHDEIGSSLCSIRLISEMSGSHTQKASDDREALSEIGTLAAQSTEALREIVWMVRSGDFPSCEMLVEQMRRSAGGLLLGLEWNFASHGSFSDQNAPLELHRDMLMFFRECLHNIARHSSATRVQIVLSRTLHGLCLSISDNGIGFDPKAPAVGQGLQNMRERAARMDGELVINSVQGGGTKIILEVPLR